MTSEFGYAGKILRVDLSTGAVTHTPTKDYSDMFLGGRGIGLKIYWDEVAPEVRAFDPENRLMFFTGPLAGVSPGVAGTRWVVCGKSPSASPEQFSYCNLGGDWGTELKFAGYDGVVVQGKSEKPVYLYIEDDTVEVRDASYIWNKKTTEVRQMLKAELGNETRILAPGPAGDNMAIYAVVFADHDASGTGGFGAVMGSKKLKAIAVRGSQKVTVADPERLAGLSDYVTQLAKGSTEAGGQSTLVAPVIKEEDHCRGCDVGCARDVYQAKNGTRSKFICEPAYWYTIRASRYYEGKEEWSEIPFLATALCNEYGVDINALDALVYWLTKCYRAGIISDESTGIPFSRTGSLEYVDTLLKKMSFREGFGDIIAQGTTKAAELLGGESEKLITDFMINAGQNAAYNPRFYILTGLLYAMEPRQPIQQLHDISSPFLKWVNWIDKKENAYVSTDVLINYARKFLGGELAIDFSTYQGKALAAKKIQDRVYAKESLILCDRTWPIRTTLSTEDRVGDPSLESQVLSAVTGRETDEEGLYNLGERLFNLQRAVRVREVGCNDTLPDSHFTIPQKRVYSNPGAIALKKEGDKFVTFVKKDASLDKGKFEEMKKELYQLRDWDTESGRQKKTKLEQLGLGDIAQDLTKRGLAV